MQVLTCVIVLVLSRHTSKQIMSLSATRSSAQSIRQLCCPLPLSHLLFFPFYHSHSHFSSCSTPFQRLYDVGFGVTTLLVNVNLLFYYPFHCDTDSIIFLHRLHQRNNKNTVIIIIKSTVAIDCRPGHDIQSQ